MTQTPYRSLTDADPATWTAYRLSDEAGVQSPDNRESPGALWLVSLRDAVVSFYDEAPVYNPGGVTGPETLCYGPVDTDSDWWHEHTHRLADEAIPLATYRLWQVFTDLCLWQDEATLDIPVLTESGPHAAVVDMTAQATAVLYEVSHRLTWVILTELSNDDEETA